MDIKLPQMPKELSALIKEGNFNPAQVEVIENGQKISNRMDPTVMNFLMLASIASQAVKIRKYFDDRTPNGYIQAWTLPVTAVRQRIDLTWVAQSISFINDGPDPVHIWINSTAKPSHTINPNEAWNANFEVHKVKSFYHQCDPGDTATIRAVAQD